MPEFGISVFSGDEKQIANELAKMQKNLDWLLRSLDHLNVKRLYTEYCNIQSAAGETVIDGPTLLMYDKQDPAVLRLRQGYDDASGDFVYELYDALGVKTVGIDSNGTATFTGTITGGTLQTNLPLNSRIVITGDTLKTYYSNGVTESLNGPAWGVGADQHYGDLSFYDMGTETFRIENALTGSGWTLRPMNGGATYIGYGGANTYASGDWYFNTANSITGLATLSGTTGSGGADGHTHSIPSLTVA